MGLINFTERFANTIFSVYPEWRAYGRTLEYDEYEISVPFPSQKDACDVLSLFVEEEDEVIVRFDSYHRYFNVDCYQSEQEWLNDILAFIQGIQDETLVVATTLHDNLIQREVIEVHTLPNFPYEILHLRSWKGTYDWD